MKYKDFLNTLSSCPFCNVTQRVIIENERAFLTYSLAPYHPDHLLVVPKAHIDHLLELPEETVRDINALQKRGLRLLQQLGYENVSFLVREGNGSGKSIPHLHYHLIPNVVLGDTVHSGGEREVLSGEEVSVLVSRLTALL